MRSFFRTRRIYADWAATTPLHPRVKGAMKVAEHFWANPSALYKEAVLAKSFMEKERVRIASILSVKPEEVIVTSGGTESNNAIIRGVVESAVKAGRKPSDIHVVSTVLEHSSVKETLRRLEAEGAKITEVGTDKDGLVREKDVLSAITNKTVLVTCMYANNEMGTIQPVSKIGALIRKMKSDSLKEGNKRTFPVFHSDASQAPLYLACDLEGLRVDALTLDAHKMQGPKGVGVLILRRGTPYEPFIKGGGQEGGRRSTTESISLIAGFAEALSLASEKRKIRTQKASAVQEYFVREIRERLPDVVINGSLERRLPNNINISLPGVRDPEFAVIYLDNKGIACSTKSSCLKGEESSYAVAALGGEDWRAKKTLRFSLAPNATRHDVDTIIDALQSLPSYI